MAGKTVIAADEKGPGLGSCRGDVDSVMAVPDNKGESRW